MMGVGVEGFFLVYCLEYADAGVEEILVLGGRFCIGKEV